MNEVADHGVEFPALCVGLDVPTVDEAERLADDLDDVADVYKVGLELLAPDSRSAIDRILAHGAVFCDVKLHDIPRTVEAAATALGRSGVSFLTVHLAGGVEMCTAAVSGAQAGAAKAGVPDPCVLGVTVLTSLPATRDDIRERLDIAVESGVGGVVCAAPDLDWVNAHLRDAGVEKVLVTPGIRPGGTDSGDQKRVATPEAALGAGADMLVVARPIVAAPDPRAAATAIADAVAAEAVARAMRNR